jgi:hypothetical protein
VDFGSIIVIYGGIITLRDKFLELLEIAINAT